MPLTNIFFIFLFLEFMLSCFVQFRILIIYSLQDQRESLTTSLNHWLPFNIYLNISFLMQSKYHIILLGLVNFHLSFYLLLSQCIMKKFPQVNQLMHQPLHITSNILKILDKHHSHQQTIFKLYIGK